ncbi:MAG TPA: RidA family protein [Alphaproteobacteria bacterium]|nr:RidA family protein [Alphaproteobacteria bacterium]
MRIDPPGMKFAGMSQAVRCGDFILVSGQVALAQGKVVGTDDPAAQARQCFANIAVVLEVAGATLADVVSLRCFLTNKGAYGGYAEIKNTLFAERPPASTTVVVKELLLPELLMEVEATAWIPSHK